MEIEKKEANANAKSEAFVAAVCKGKNIKAQQMLEDMIKEKAVRRIRDVLSS